MEWAGHEVTPKNELNGIAFQGVGRGTTVDHIQVHMNADDGVEFFGGTVNVKHVLLTGILDDSLDWTDGWRGKAQFVIVEQYDDKANNGIEADNFGDNNDVTPRSAPQIANLTFIGSESDSVEGGAGILLREGTEATIYNALVTGFKDACLDIDDRSTFVNGEKLNEDTGYNRLAMINSIVDCKNNFKRDPDDVFSVKGWFLGQEGNEVANPQLKGFFPAEGSPAYRGVDLTPFDLEFFFDPVDYVGAITPDNDWTAGWTTSARK